MYKMLISFLLTATLLLSSFLTFNIPVKAMGTAYYVSYSSGNDSNSGTCSTSPWKTLTKLNSITFQPGDTIYLKKGDIWTGEILYLHGSGDYTGGNWITVTSYGKSGSKPVIAPGKDKAWAVKFDNGTRQDAWKFIGLEIRDCQQGIYKETAWEIDANAWDEIYRHTVFPLGQAQGLWIEDCLITDIYGAPIGAGKNPNVVTHCFTSEGLFTMGTEYVTIKDNTFSYCGLAFDIRLGQHVNIDNVVSDHCFQAGMWLSNVKEAIVDNCKILYAGWRDGMSFGVAGFEVNVGLNIVVQDTEIGYVGAFNGVPDGCGFDFEGDNRNVDLKGLYIHDCAAQAILMFRNPNWGSEINNVDTDIEDCIIENCGLRYDNYTTYQAAFMSIKDNYTNGGTFSDNTIILKNPNQYRFNDRGTYTYRNPEGFSYIDNTWLEPDVVKWGFDVGGPEGITSAGISNFAVDLGGYLNGTIASADPYIKTLDNLGIDAGAFKSIRIRMKNSTSSNVGAVYFKREGDTNFSSTMKKAFTTIANDTGYTEYVVDMSDVESWSGEISQIRIDPTEDASNGSFSIDYLWVEKQPGSGNFALSSMVSASSSLENTDWGKDTVKDTVISSVYGAKGWSSNSSLGNNHSEWIELDLGSAKGIKKVDLYPTTLGMYFPIDFTIQVSENGNSWKTIANEVNYPLPSDGTVQSFESEHPEIARYIKITGTKLRTDGNEYKMQLSEVEVYGLDVDNREFTAEKQWNFDSDTEGWTVARHISDFSWQPGGYVEGEISGYDPYIRSADNLGIDIENDKFIRIRLKNNTDSVAGQIFFTTASDAAWDGLKSKTFTIKANDDGYTEYEINMSDISKWDGTLRRLRIDPASFKYDPAATTWGTFIIDSITIGRYE